MSSQSPDPEEVPDDAKHGRWSALFWGLAFVGGLAMFAYGFSSVPFLEVADAQPIGTIHGLRSTFSLLSLLGGGGTVAIVVFMLYRYASPKRDSPAKLESGDKRYTLAMYSIAVAFLVLMTIFMGASALAKTDEAVQPTQQVGTDKVLNMDVTGGQWFWRFDVDGVPYTQGRRLVLPAKTVIKYDVTSADVIHSFAVEELGVKKDAVPGQTNHGWFYVDAVEGDEQLSAGDTTVAADEYQINCAELCGKGHSQMVATLYVVSPDDYRTWVQAQNGTVPQSASSEGGN